MKKLADFFTKMVTAGSGLSSKRVCGFLGWIVCLFVLVFATIKQIQAPDIFSVTAMCVLGLLGVDSITSIWKQK